MGGEGTVDAIVEAWRNRDATLAGLGWIIGVALEDLGLADVVGRRLLG